MSLDPVRSTPSQPLRRGGEAFPPQLIVDMKKPQILCACHTFTGSVQPRHSGSLRAVGKHESAWLLMAQL